jgi:hypothetical protein
MFDNGFWRGSSRKQIGRMPETLWTARYECRDMIHQL